VNKAYLDTNFLELSGGTMTGDLGMGLKKITNLANPTNSNDGVNKAYLDINFLELTGGTMLGNLNMGSKKITNLANPTNSNDGVNKVYLDNNFLPLTGGTISSNLLCQNYVTIGNTAVNTYPLEITSTAPNLSTAFTSGYTMTSGGVSAISPTLNSTVSLKTSGSIWSQARLIVSSDRRIKYDIEKVDYNTSNEIIKQIQPYKYKMIETNRDEYGYIAQEIRPIIPECIDIHTCKLPNGVTVDDYLTIDYKQINIHLMNTVKDLLQRIEKLEKIII
jgi:hypothetical protein